jgi:hypothetical protein
LDEFWATMFPVIEMLRELLRPGEPKSGNCSTVAIRKRASLPGKGMFVQG